ncbi:hypothetical protein [Actinomyces radicidentis]|nr:hypothetical protein [Actinomyces radicidentis]
MLTRLASLIVDHRGAVIGLMAVLTVLAAVLVPRVTVNTDMTS